MKHIQLGMTAILLALTVGCGGVKPEKDEDRNGDVYPEAKAKALITSFARWCYNDVDGDKIFGTHVFLQSGTGEFAIYNSATRSWKSSEAMTWNINNDLLTMNLSNSKQVLRRKMRFVSEQGRTLLVLINMDGQGKATLYSCNL